MVTSTDPAAWMEFFKTLGVAAPLIGFLVFIYQKTDSERRETQGNFLQALQTTITAAAVDRQANTAALVDLRTSMTELTAMIRERGLSSGAEHEKQMALLDRIASKLESQR